MASLFELAQILRSKNAGPLFVTFDVIFADCATFKQVLASRALTPTSISRLYDVAEADVRIIPYATVNAIKITIPRKHVSGAIQDGDIYGCQQHLPLGSIRIENSKGASL
ncbi:MAG: DUF4387 domain-containing protein [Bacillota bacterium]|nr:DUF4387 domain-containing protein [Bacillota bacterium]